jgi:outer membrane biosynthesis protein TonB
MRSQRSGGGRPARSGGARVRRQIILLSILLHILFLSFWDGAIRLDLSQALPVAAPAKSAPLVFDLQQPEMPREVIATPDDARTTDRPQKADFLSDKNALARNQEPAPALPVTGDPFSRGDLASHDLLPALPSPGSEGAPAQPSDPAAETGKNEESESSDAADATDAARAVSPDRNPAGAPRQPFRLDLPGVPHQQLEARAAEDGGLSFNTYDWDFAPYMLALKERISRNIFPPLAFTKLGMIDGDTMLRFKIYPDGRLSDLELLGYTGHHSLMQTSRFAITASAPFPGLPADFPKSYLEVTAKFSYFVKK